MRGVDCTKDISGGSYDKLDDFLVTSDGKIELTPNEWASISAMLSDESSPPISSPSPAMGGVMDASTHTDLRNNHHGEVVRKKIIETILKRRKNKATDDKNSPGKSHSSAISVLYSSSLALFALSLITIAFVECIDYCFCYRQKM